LLACYLASDLSKRVPVADFNGLDGSIGDLMVLPRSHYAHWDSTSFAQLWGSEALPGTRTFSDLPPGSAVIAHSALMHGRRQKPGGADSFESARYFVDVSYCQPGRNRWPASGNCELEHPMHAPHHTTPHHTTPVSGCCFVPVQGDTARHSIWQSRWAMIGVKTTLFVVLANLHRPI
jgi:hypothetical protein